MVDIHKYAKKLEWIVIKIRKSPISEKNKEALLDFYRRCTADGIGAGKVQRYLNDLLRFALQVNKDFVDWNKNDIETLIIRLEQSIYTEWTKYSYKVAIRKFFKWLRASEELPDEVRWIKLKMKHNSKLPEELVTEEEVKRMIQVADNYRDKALLATLYESGCRIYELMNLQLKHVTLDGYGATITVRGKTGSRRVRLVSSVFYLQEWINKHPNNHLPESYVWIQEKKQSEIVGYDRVLRILRNLAKRGGVNKKVNPHNFRHARASFMANHLTESQLKEVFGWTQASRMASVYVHLSGKNTDHAVLKIYGKVIETETTKKPLMPIECERCKTQNESTNKFCKLCGLILDDEARKQIMTEEIKKKSVEELMEKLLQDNEVRSLVVQKIKEVKS